MFTSGIGPNRRFRLSNDVLLVDGAPARPEAGEVMLMANTGESTEWDPAMLDRIGVFLHHADRVIIAAAEERRGRWVRALKGLGVDVELLAIELGRLGPIALRSHGPHPTLLVGSKPLGFADATKSVFLTSASALPRSSYWRLYF